MAKKTTDYNGLQVLKQDIRGKAPRRLYFFHGEESFLLHHYLGQLRKLLLDELTETFNFHKFTNENFDLQGFADAVENLPMMAEHTLVVADDIDIYRLPEADREGLGKVFRDIPEYCTVVFTYITVEWRPDGRLKKLHEPVSECGLQVEFYRQEPRDLVPWITRHFASLGKRITPELCHYLIELTGGTMTALSGEIRKLSAYVQGEQILKSDIDTVTEPVMEAVVFQMVDLLSQGACGQALVKLRTLLKLQEEPVRILGFIGGHFRNLATARTLTEHGKGIRELMKLTNLTEYPAKKAMAGAGKFSHRFYARAAELVLQTDERLKTSFDGPQRLLELLLLALAQEAKYG